MKTRLSALTFLAATAAAGLLAVLARGATAASAQMTMREAASNNWAGYTASGNSFSSVSGAWTVPAANANPEANEGYSATWVGLGGSSEGSSSLEQAGTESDYVDGQAQYSAWYELLPANQVKLNLAVHPGDNITSTVGVSGTTVTISLTDETTNDSVVKKLQMTSPDTSSAEWIVEAPSTQDNAGNTQVLPLTDFGKVSFTGVTATAGGHTGGISDSNWQATQVQLSSGDASAVPDGAAAGFVGPQAASQSSSASATTSALSGAGFTVTWTDAGGSGQPAVADYSPYGSGYPYGYGYGYGDPYSYGYGSGYGPGTS